MLCILGGIISSLLHATQIMIIPATTQREEKEERLGNTSRGVLKFLMTIHGNNKQLN